MTKKTDKAAAEATASDMDMNAVKTAPELKDPAQQDDKAEAIDAPPNPLHPEATDAAEKIDYAEEDPDMDANAVKTAPEMKEKEAAPKRGKKAAVDPKVGDVFNGWRVDELYDDEDGQRRARIVSVANPLISSAPLAADLGSI